MRYLHLSYDKIEKFELRVPQNRIEGEDGETKRICLSTSIESAVNAKPGSAELLKIALDRNLALVFYLYTVKIGETDVIPPEQLVRKYGVLDAELNQEHWITHIPIFREELYLLDGAEFEQVPERIYPLVRTVQAHRIFELPEFCAQKWVEEVNRHTQSSFSTAVLLGELPGLEKRLESQKYAAKEMKGALRAMREEGKE